MGLDNVNVIKFDICLMNPPYDKNMHLKFLSKMIKTAGTVVSVQPAGYLLDLPAVLGWKTTTYQKFEHNVSSHINDIDLLSAKEMNDMFRIGTFEKLGIYQCDSKKHDTYKTVFMSDERKIFSIFLKTIQLVYDGKVDNIKDHIAISMIHGHPDSEDEFDIITPQYEIAKKVKPDDMTEQEFINWHESCSTKFMKYCNLLTRQGQHLQPQWLPYMGDYTRKWNDKDFYDFFNLTEEEQNHIEQTMKKHVL